MTTQLFVLLLITIVLAVYGGIAVYTWLRLRGTRVVTCPETHKPAAVKVDLGHATVTAVWDKPDLKLECCSRWPDRAGCDEACVPLIAEGGDDTRAKTIAAKFFEGKRCAICGHAIDPIHAATLQPGLLHPVTHEVAAWEEIAPQDLPEAFASRRPLCGNCTLAEAFRHRFPDRVVDRIPRPGSLVQ
jgi:hypothetical protein